VSRSELEDLQASLVACGESVQLLHRFVRLNVDAVSRILIKAAVLGGSEDCLAEIDARVQQLSPGLWLSSLNTTLRHVREAIKHKTGAPPRSLLLERGGAHFLPGETVTLLLHDDAPRLKTALNTSYSDESQERQHIIAWLLKTAVVLSSHGCLHTLLRSLHPKTQPSGLDEYCGDYLHGVVQYLSRLPDYATPTDVFHKILKSIRPSPLPLLRHRDQLGRVPLHYAAAAGLEAVCREIVGLMHDPSIVFSQDSLHKTPLDYAVEQGHTAVVEILLNVSAPWEDDTHMQSLPATAIRSQFLEIAQLLTKQGFGHQFTSKRGENLLHLAAEQGLAPLISGLVGLGVNINAQEDVRGRTPLTTACIQGHEDTVLAILLAGADTSIRDHQGWLAKDHATYRGHTRVVNSITTKGSPILATKAPRVSSILPQRASTESVIFVNLGTLDLFKPTPQVNVSQYRKRIFPAQIPDTEFTLSISLAGDSKQEQTVQLPFLSDNSDCPWCFTTDDPENAVLVFKLVNTLEPKTVGTAIAMLSSLKGVLGNARESLIRDFTVPLFHHRHTHVGSVVFTFVIAHPYEGSQPPPETVQTLKMERETIIGGHRGKLEASYIQKETETDNPTGNGWNDGAHRLQLGENTLQVNSAPGSDM
jgi:glycerophosphodiester phosphodiesterase